MRDPLVRLDLAVPFLREKAGTFEGHFRKKRNKSVKNPFVYARWALLFDDFDSPFFLKIACAYAISTSKKEHFDPKKE